jgi:hypothetical protein
LIGICPSSIASLLRKLVRQRQHLSANCAEHSDAATMTDCYLR